jgi:hypothetical protein
MKTLYALFISPTPILVFGSITSTLIWHLAFGAGNGKLLWPLSQLQGDYVGLWHTYWEIMLAFGTVTGRLF